MEQKPYQPQPGDKKPFKKPDFKPREKPVSKIPQLYTDYHCPRQVAAIRFGIASAEDYDTNAVIEVNNQVLRNDEATVGLNNCDRMPKSCDFWCF